MTVHRVLGDRYELSGLLGVGGMGEIYEGRDILLDRPVAIKVLRPEVVSKPDVRQRFESEARAAATLTHPCIVTVYDTGESDGRPYLVMERLPGRTLADELAVGPLPEERIRALLIGILDALVAAHEAGILHRDIKPANVLITDTGGVKVTDFGIAKIVGDDLTRTGELVGTVAYLSPDRIAGREANVTDDLYALGIIGYEALSGRKPFTEDNILSLARAITQEEVVPLADARPDADPGLVAVVERAMAREPFRRFASARDMLAALKSRTGNYAAPAAPRVTSVDDAVTTAPLTAAFGRNDRPRGVALATILTLLGVVAVGVLALVWGQGAESPPPTTSETRTPGVSASLPERTQASTTTPENEATTVPTFAPPAPVPVLTPRVEPPAQPDGQGEADDDPGNSGNGNSNGNNGNGNNGNSGNGNSGNGNSGNGNSGDSNRGNGNSGNGNSGDSNRGNGNGR